LTFATIPCPVFPGGEIEIDNKLPVCITKDEGGRFESQNPLTAKNILIFCKDHRIKIPHITFAFVNKRAL
jgi:hypothetical protein